MSPLSKFVALEVSYAVAAALVPVIERLRKRSASLADQLERAAASIPLNLAEGSRRVGRDQLHMYRTADASCAEIRAALRVAAALGHLGGLDLTECERFLDREAGLLHGLTHRRI